MRARSVAASWTSVAPAFSSMRSVLRVPGMGAMSSPWVSSQASASWAVVMPLVSARSLSCSVACRL